MSDKWSLANAARKVEFKLFTHYPYFSLPEDRPSHLSERPCMTGLEVSWRKISITLIFHVTGIVGTNIALLRNQTLYRFVFEVGKQQKQNPARNVKRKHMLWVPQLHQWR